MASKPTQLRTLKAQSPAPVSPSTPFTSVSLETSETVITRNPFGSNFRLVGELLVVLYLVASFGVTASFFSEQFRTFDCVDPFAASLTRTRWSRTYENPDPILCERRGITVDSLFAVPVLIVFGPLLKLRKML